MNTNKLTETKFRNAVKRAGVTMEPRNGHRIYSKAFIIRQYDANNKLNWSGAEATQFAIDKLTATDVIKLMIAGFTAELINVAGEAGSREDVYVFSKNA